MLRVNRLNLIMLTSIIGIICNILLVVFKVGVGFFINSLTLILDGINNLTDIFSLCITILGTKLGARKPDKEHPLGHGRYEYIAALLISIFIIYAGFSALSEAIKRIIKPSSVSYTYLSLVIIIIFIISKLLLAFYTYKIGKYVNSPSLLASGIDASFDALTSLASLISAFLIIFTSYNIEGYLAFIIALFFIYNGFKSLRLNISSILGERVDSSLTKTVYQTICAIEGVEDVFDLFMFDLGASKLMLCGRIEVNSTLSAKEIDVLSRKVENTIKDTYGFYVGAIGIYAKSESLLQKELFAMVMSYPGVLQVHGFQQNNNVIRLDIVLSLAQKDRELIFQNISQDLQNKYPHYLFELTLDSDISDIIKK